MPNTSLLSLRSLLKASSFLAASVAVAHGTVASSPCGRHMPRPCGRFDAFGLRYDAVIAGTDYPAALDAEIAATQRFE